MKNFIKKIKPIGGSKLLVKIFPKIISREAISKAFPKLIHMIESAIEHNFFKPLSISIITCFILINGIDYAQSYIEDYKELKLKERQMSTIKINIPTSDVNFDLEEDQVTDYRVKSGDTMLKILVDLGASESDVFSILAAMKKIYDPKSISMNDRISIKYKVKVSVDPNKKETAEAEADESATVGRKVLINSISVVAAEDQEIVVSRKSDGQYDAREIKINLLRYISRYSGTIKNGLFVDGVESGISPTSMMNMIGLYSYDIDFQRDIRSGNKFEMLVESFYTEDGKKVRDGNVLFSSLTLQNRNIEIYMHKISGKAEYFDSKGNSVRKSLLRTPINGARVSSSFGMRRHPILGFSKMHKGIDFAAASGTPILAAGSGTITYYGPKGGYGNFVQIKHSPDYSTAYGHASRFVSKLRNGSKVKQGDVVAYVGSTGRSTGPHLHFEVMFKGQAINPTKVKATSGLTLSGKELARFEAVKAEINRYRKTIPNQIK